MVEPRRPRIVIVTAHILFGRFLMQFLRQSDYEPHCFTDFTPAIASMKHSLPRLLITGWVFRNETAEKSLLELEASFPGLPVLVCSGGAIPADLRWPHLAKPCTAAAVLEAVGRLLEKG